MHRAFTVFLRADFFSPACLPLAGGPTAFTLVAAAVPLCTLRDAPVTGPSPDTPSPSPDPSHLCLSTIDLVSHPFGTSTTPSVHAAPCFCHWPSLEPQFPASSTKNPFYRRASQARHHPFYKTPLRLRCATAEELQTSLRPPQFLETAVLPLQQLKTQHHRIFRLHETISNPSTLPCIEISLNTS